MSSLTRKAVAAFPFSASVIATGSPALAATAPLEQQSATVPFTNELSPPSTDPGGATPADGSGTTWAPGGLLASNSVHVKGTGLWVSTGAVSYQMGASQVNVCPDAFEIAYYKNGVRQVQSAGGHCAVGRATHTWTINQNLDEGSSFCGRAMVDGRWGNYACVTIHS